ncbi:MAG TPA: 3-isopropylmalate dehydratase large subunit, partial [Thermoplasmata archaeon]|nr:3-isopropylmalate dehydratase large subunit [Thermoplasmata archaeon]
MGGQTISEKILEKASGRERVAPGDIVEANVDLLYMHEMLAMAILPLNEIGVEKVWDPSKIVVTLDHWVPPPTPEIAKM